MTKNSSLPETDLARVALLPDEHKYKQLLQIKRGMPSITYTPVRAEVPAIFNARPELIELPKSSWEDIETAIQKRCTQRPKSLEPNLIIAKTLFKYAEDKGYPAFHWDFMSVPIGRGAKIGLWHNFYFIENDKPVICYTDPRRHNGLTELARDFVFSVMHHNLARGDFTDAQFRIFKFATDANNDRVLEVHSFDESRLIPEKVINQAIDATYNLWFDVLEEREQATRKQPISGTGGLFGW